MNKSLQLEIKKYIKEVKSLVFCNNKLLKEFLKDFECDVVSYTEENNITDINSIIQHFGTPESVAKGFLESTDLKLIRKRIRIKNVILAGILIAVTVWAVGVTFAVIEGVKSINGYSVEQPIIENTIDEQGDLN